MPVLLVVTIFGIAFLSHTAPFPFLLEAFRPGRSIWHVPQKNGARNVYLTFDDGPNVAWTPRVLDALREEGARATFFLIEEHITPDTEWVVRRIAAEGHALALHSGSRKPMVMSDLALAAALTRHAERIAAVAGRPPCRMFRPHAGWRSSTMYDALAKVDYRLVGWSWGMWDWNWWKTLTAEAVSRRLARKVSPGDVIVIHDGHHKDPSRDRRHAGAAVQLLVPALRARGYTFVPLCEAGGAPTTGPFRGSG